MGIGYPTIMYDAAELETAFGDIEACRYDGIEIGLGKVEAAGPNTVGEWLDVYDLDLYCVMGNWIESEADAEHIADQAEMVANLGAKYLGILPTQRHRKDDETVESWLRTISKAAMESGITPLLHHHGATHIERGDEIRHFLDAVDGLELLFDTAHWYPYSKNYPEGDVTDGIERFADDIEYVHLKDIAPGTAFTENRDALSNPNPHLDNVINYFRTFTDLGNGVIDFESTLTALNSVDYDGHYSIEIENQIDKSLIHAKENIDYWQNVVAGNR